MLERIFKISNPTWKRVVDALRLGDYNGLADNIENELQG